MQLRVAQLADTKEQHISERGDTDRFISQESWTSLKSA